MKHTATLSIMKYSSKMNTLENSSIVIFFTINQEKYSFINLIQKMGIVIIIFIAFGIRLFKEKYVERNKEKVFVKEK